MSTQRGNTSRTRPQKYQNCTPFRNNLYDTSNKTKLINNIHVVNVCTRCKNIIEWKIKYKKYKPLKAPKKCTKCDQKNITHAYHILCSKCARDDGVCPKCGKKEELIKDVVSSDDLRKDADIIQALKHLSERKRRTILRTIARAKDPNKPLAHENITKEVILEKIGALINDDTLSDDGSDSDSDAFEDAVDKVAPEGNTSNEAAAVQQDT